MFKNKDKIFIVAEAGNNHEGNFSVAKKLVKKAAEILGGKGGGGRKDFAQAGGLNKEKIKEAFKTLSKKIN